MDCSDCAAEIEHAVGLVNGVDTVRVSIGSQLMTLHGANLGPQLPAVERRVKELGYELQRVTGDAEPVAHTTPAYQRALWIVVALNAGYGIIQLAGGFLSDSQALKADALDFLGDGLITGLGILAIGWGLLWRARSALLQGIFLALLGIGVLGNAVYRLQAGYEPEASLERFS